MTQTLDELVRKATNGHPSKESPSQIFERRLLGSVGEEFLNAAQGHYIVNASNMTQHGYQFRYQGNLFTIFFDDSSTLQVEVESSLGGVNGDRNGSYTNELLQLIHRYTNRPDENESA